MTLLGSWRLTVDIERADVGQGRADIPAIRQECGSAIAEGFEEGVRITKAKAERWQRLRALLGEDA